MFIRKFYEIGIAEPATGGPINLAEIMVKSGKLANPGQSGETPKVNTSETTVQPTTAPAPAPATATAPQPAEPAKPEPQKPTEPAKPASAQTEPPTPPISWQEVLKQQQPNAIFKELGYGEQLAEFLHENKDLDPKLVNLLKHWKTSDGNMEPYLKALTTDFSKMPPEEVMRHQLKEQYPELDAKQLERLYNIKVVQRYKLDPQNNSEEDIADGQVELLADAKPVRQALVDKQQEYLLPKPVQRQAEPDQQAQQQQRDAEAWTAKINDSPVIKNIVANKYLTVGKGEDAYNIPVDPQRVVSILNNADEWVNSLFTTVQKPDGTTELIPNFEKQALVSAVMADDIGTIEGLAKHYKALGARSAVAPIENASIPGTSQPAKAEVSSNDPAKEMAKRGRVVRGGE